MTAAARANPRPFVGRGLNRTIGLAVAAIALVAVVGSVLVFGALEQVNRATASRGRSNEVISALGEFQAAMLNQETGVRGYLLTGRSTSLEPYEQGRARLDEAIAKLHAVTGRDAQQDQLLREAEAAARDWQTRIGEVAVRENANPATTAHAHSLEASGEGKASFDRVRAALSTMERAEFRAYAEKSGVVDRAERAALAALVVSTGLTLLICLGVGAAINRMISRPLVALADAMGRLMRREMDVAIPAVEQRNEVGVMARAVQVLKESLIALDRTSLLRATADSLPALVGYVDAERRLGFLNEEFTRWFDLDTQAVAEVQGKPLDEVFRDGSFPGDGKPLAAALAGEDTRFALGLTTRDGVAREIEAYFRPHRAPDGRVLGVVTLFTDVSDRKDVDRRLRIQARDLQRSNAELEQFAYVASHDLKAPLRGIENLATWIEEDLADQLTGDTRTNMDLMRSRVRRLEALLDDLLAYSRAGRGDLVVRQTDTRALVEELAGLISPPAGFVIEGSDRLPTLTAAHAALSQLLQNLIGNAVKHHPDPAHGHVWVDAEPHGDEFEFTVADDGSGIPEQFHDRVFGMFQTLRPRDEVEGSGMGLAIVRKLVERQGGRVWLSDRPGGGLIVHFTWPTTPGEA